MTPDRLVATLYALADRCERDPACLRRLVEVGGRLGAAIDTEVDASYQRGAAPGVPGASPEE